MKCEFSARFGPMNKKILNKFRMQLSTLDYNSEKVDKLEVLALQTFEDTVVKT